MIGSDDVTYNDREEEGGRGEVDGVVDDTQGMEVCVWLDSWHDKEINWLGRYSSLVVSQ